MKVTIIGGGPGGLYFALLAKEAGCDLIDVSTGQTVPQRRPVYGRMYQAPFSDWVRNEVGIATRTVGAGTSADQVNTLVAAGRDQALRTAARGRAELRSRARPASHEVKDCGPDGGLL